MDFIAELLADAILAFGIYLFQWCVRHKNATLTILAVALIVVDVIALYYMIRVRQ